jgi:hypothetical protein
MGVKGSIIGFEMGNNRRITKGKQLLQQARALLNQVEEDIRTRRFSSDDVRMETYNDLIAAAANLFPEDPILNGQMVKMPDANLQYLGWAYLMKFPEVTSQRTKEHLTRLINRLEILLGEEPTQRLLDERDFSFIADQKLRKVLRLDFIEAQESFAVGAYKACGLIEGMLLDIFQRPIVVTEQELDKVARRLNLPRSGQSIDWDRVSMTNLIKMSRELGLVSEPVLKFAEGARDIRDTVHPRAELRQTHRASRDEAEILLQLVKLIYNDLVERLSAGENE